jgi:CRISPR-associated protein Cas5t
LVDEVSRLRPGQPIGARAYLLDPENRGRLSLPVWVDHVGSAGTRRVSGNLDELAGENPPLELMPKIGP